MLRRVVFQCAIVIKMLNKIVIQGVTQERLQVKILRLFDEYVKPFRLYIYRDILVSLKCCLVD
jgi:hypothetical protein